MKQGITKYFFEIYLKMTEWRVIFRIAAALIQKTRNEKREKTLQKQSPRGVLQIYIWQLYAFFYKQRFFQLSLSVA